MTNQFNIGDVIFVGGITYRISPRGGVVGGTLTLVPTRQCETLGCTNPALDVTTQIAPATNVRVCADCATVMTT